MQKGGLQFTPPLIWVCRNPGINLSRLQELGYASLEDLRVGRWNREESLDWSANNTMQAEQLYSEITRFEGKSLLEGEVVANTEREAFVYESQPVEPSFNIDFGECVNVYGRGPMFVQGKRLLLRENQPVMAIVDFKNVEGTFNILVTDKQRMKHIPNYAFYKSH